MSKRSHQGAFGEGEILLIKLAAAGEPIEARAFEVRGSSSCAYNLPQGAKEWDLSTILVYGRPVTCQVVVAWLNSMYWHEHEELFQEPEPPLGSTMTGLYQLLSFADAVGSKKGLLRACLSQLGELQLHAQLGAQDLQLLTDGKSYVFLRSNKLQLGTINTTLVTDVGAAAASVEEKAAFMQQVTSQTEQLLHLAYKLQLSPLIDRLHTFVQQNTMQRISIFSGVLDQVFTLRVLDAALGPNQLGKVAWINSVLTQPAGVGSGGVSPSQLLCPVDLTEQQLRPIKFKAILQRDFKGWPKGTLLPVELDQFGDQTIKIGVAVYSVQLLIGRPLHDAAVTKQIMGPDWKA